ncbi:hypothetical protein RDV89_14225 [Nocardioides zeae]|uniref:NERD domain-containing protein n=1 Tax=Nocardioides imazamoxiresistens TaxID=3231893 RepID=A0ABU3PYB3_9ACTN|nr:hypothetical protein [Nocardioides zeae]MDT9594236.1 hypothetical protein [Nocardioides zeae]
MGKFDPYSRRELRRRRRAWLLERKTMLALQLAVAVALFAFVTPIVWFTLPIGDGRWYVLGVLHTVVVAAWLHVLHETHLASDAKAIQHVRGANGEEMTRYGLQTAKRRRRIWGWVDSIQTTGGDIDHLVLTRTGGVVVMDSKWRTRRIDPDEADRIAESARRAATRAEGVLRTKLPRERGTHRAPVRSSLTVTPLVVVWGPAQDELPPDAERGGVRFVPGRALQTWLRALDGEAMSQEAATDLLAKLREFRLDTWSPLPVPPGTRSPASLRRSRPATPPPTAARG